MEKQKACLFCNSVENKLSNEHVFPKWLIKHLGISDTKIFQIERKRDKDFLKPGEFIKYRAVEKSLRQMTPNSFVSGKVCIVCNNGWMSQLESQALPILVPLMDQSNTLFDLTPAQKLIVSRWAAKTAITYNSCANYERIVPDIHAKTVFNQTNTLPDGIAVFAYQFHNAEKFIARQTRHWIRQDFNQEKITEKNFHALCAQSYKISFMIGNLALLVACWPPTKGWMFLLEPSLHQHILWNWQRPVAINVLGENFKPQHGAEAHFLFHTLLGISNKTL